ncbi:MAG: NrdH-redoxin [Actinobacteria bacterium]|nr:NrdH-redoxin [Actinomycetota bacterium]
MTAPEITMYGADWCGDCRRAKTVLDASGVGYTYIDVDAVVEAAADTLAISGRTNIPVIVFPDGTHQVEPSNADLEAKLRSLAS